MWNLNYDTNELISMKQKQTCRQNRPVVAKKGEGHSRTNGEGEWGQHM